MKALIKETPQPGLRLADVDRPVPADDEVVIKTKAVAICGTDIHFYRWDAGASNFDVQLPIVIGHECSGEIVDVGKAVRSFSLGDRISIETHVPCGSCFQCRVGNGHICMNMELVGISRPGAFAEYMPVPEKVAFKLPDTVCYEEGSLFEPAGVAMHGVDQAAVSDGDTVVVLGCGPIGLVAVQLALAAGASVVAAVDVDQFRLNLAESFGAIAVDPQKDDVVRTVAELSGGKGGADIVIELSGASEVYSYIFDLIRFEGRLVTIGHPSHPLSIDVSKMINQRGIGIKGIFGRRIWETWHHLADAVTRGKIDLSRIITHRFVLEEYEKAFEQTKNNSAKVLFMPKDG